MSRTSDRVCKVCGSEFSPVNARQIYCSGRCREVAKYRRFKLEKQLQEEAEAVAVWRDRYAQNLKRCVCKECLTMFWDSEEKQFCCEEHKQFWEVTNNDFQKKVSSM